MSDQEWPWETDEEPVNEAPEVDEGSSGAPDVVPVQDGPELPKRPRGGGSYRLTPDGRVEKV